MTKVDQFESVFKAADKPVYEYAPYQCEHVLVVTDLDGNACTQFQEHVAAFFKNATGLDSRWSVLRNNDYQTLQELLERIEHHKPALICTYRNLQSNAWKWPFSLGEALDVMTQVVDCPVLVLPHPLLGNDSWCQAGSQHVMAITDHLAGDHRLVNAAVGFTSRESGQLFLSHIEDKLTFDRYIELISKIPSIDTDEAREELQARILREPRDYIQSCRSVLAAHGVALQIEPIVTVGRRIDDYRRLIEEHDINLLVLNTKDHDQLAMHGVAYPLAVELRHVPMLML